MLYIDDKLPFTSTFDNYYNPLERITSSGLVQFLSKKYLE